MLRSAYTEKYINYLGKVAPFYGLNFKIQQVASEVSFLSVFPVVRFLSLDVINVLSFFLCIIILPTVIYRSFFCYYHPIDSFEGKYLILFSLSVSTNFQDIPHLL